MAVDRPRSSPSPTLHAAANVKIAVAFLMALIEAVPFKIHTVPKHPWTNGQVERIKPHAQEGYRPTYHYKTHRQLKQHLAAFLDAYSFEKWVKTSEVARPTKPSVTHGPDQPHRFRDDPTHFRTER